MYVNFNILNQLGSPSINSNTFANRPAAGQTGRLFVSTDTFEIYRDNGTTWDLIGGPGAGTITGSGTATQVAYFTGAQTIGSSANLFWDNTNTRLGIGTATPGVRLDIHGTGTLQSNNSTGATNNNYLQFQRAGANVWRIGDTYNGGTNYYSIFNSGLSTNAALFYAATNKGEFTATETIAAGLATGTQFTYNLTVPNATTFGSPNAITALGMFTNMTLQGNSTVPIGTRQGFDANQRISFTTAGTMTVTQGSTVRAFSNLNTVWSFNGTQVGTITHLAGIRVVFPDNIGSAVNVTNNYGILINNQTTGLGTVNYTNRWGIYQEGTSDINTFAGNVLVGTTTNVGFNIYTNGSLRTDSSTTLAATSGGVLIGSTGAISTNAALQIDSTSAGVLLPRMTTAQRNAISGGPSAGLTVYNTSSNTIDLYNGTSWTSLSSGLTGSGTALQLAFWSTSTNLSTSSLIYWDNTKYWLGINTNTPGGPLDLNVTNGGFLPPRLTTAQRNALVSPATASTIYNTTTGDIEFYNGTSWIGTGGAAGITGSGTTNYLPKFTAGTVVGDSRFFDNGTVTFLGNGDVNAAPSTGIFSGTGGTGTNIAGAELRIRGGASTGNAAGGPITFYTSAAGSAGTGVNAATEVARFDTRGNLGINTTPQSWGTSYRAIQIGQRGVLWAHTAAGSTYLSENIWDDGSASKYIVTGAAAGYQMASGAHYWYQAASGTAGANITLNTSMFLNTSNNLGIGTTTIGSRLQVNGNAAIGYSASRAASTNGLAIAGNLNVGTGWTTQDAWIEIGTERTGNGNGYIDITTDTTYTDYGLRIIRGNTGANAISSITVRGTGGISIITEEAGAINFNTTNTNRLTIPAAGGLTFADANNIAFNTTTGTKIGTATNQKLAFWNATPIVQPTTGVAGAARVAGGGAAVTDTDTFGGYTIAQVVAALRNVGLLA